MCETYMQVSTLKYESNVQVRLQMNVFTLRGRKIFISLLLWSRIIGYFAFKRLVDDQYYTVELIINTFDSL